MEHKLTLEEGGDLSTVIGFQFLWIGILLCFFGVQTLGFDLEYTFSFLATDPHSIFTLVWQQPPNFQLIMVFPLLSWGCTFTVLGLLSVDHWVKLYRRDLALERKMGYY